MFKNFLETFRVNRIVRYFVLCDLILFSGWGLVSPIFSIFVIDGIEGASLFTVGVSASIYWMTRAFVQMPVANFIDKREGEKDDFNILISGLVLASISAFAFSIISTVPALYALQVFHGLAFGLYASSWSSVFSRHLDKSRIAFDWSLDSTMLAISSGVTGLLGGYVASQYGFDAVFLTASALSFVAAVLIFLVPDFVLPKPNKPSPGIMDHTPRTTLH